MAQASGRGGVGRGDLPLDPGIRQLQQERSASTDTVLRRGSRGDAVRRLQRVLGVTVDGSFGPATERALRAYQQRNGLTVDGVAGPQTWAFIASGKSTRPAAGSSRSGGGGGGSAGGGGGSGGSGTGGGGVPAGGGDVMSELEKAFGWQLPFFKSDKELYGIFQKAVKENWDGVRFESAMRGSNWYKTHSEAWRKAKQQETTDPASFNASVANRRAEIGKMAGEIGSSASGAFMDTLARNSIYSGWNEETIRQQLAGQISVGSVGKAAGTVGQVRQALRETGFRNGINVSDSYIQGWARKVVTGGATLQDAQQALRDTYAKTLAPGFAKEIEAGQDLYDLASPYMQTMARTLELNPADIDLFDTTIRKALASSSDKDGQVGSTPLWQFEQQLKKDRRWLSTKNARDEMSQVAHQIATMFGQTV